MTEKQNNDVKVKDLFKVVQGKKEEIEKIQNPCWNTSRTFGFTANSGHDRIDIGIITDTRKLVEMLSFLIDRKEKSEKAAKRLDVKYEFSWLGFSLDEWEEDFKTRVNQIQIQEKRKELSNLEARLNAIISPELKAEMELQSIQKALNEEDN